MKKITEEELKTIIAHQTKLGNLYNQIGSLEFNKSLKLAELNKTHEAADKLKIKLEKKYGSVNINLEDGSITEIEQPEKVIENV